MPPKNLFPSVREFVHLMEKMPSPCKVLTPQSLERCACGHLKQLSEFAIQSTGLVKFTNNVCKGCRKDWSGLATIVCINCKSIIGRHEPCKNKHGFKFEKDSFYHVKGCPKCMGGDLKSSQVLEMVVFYKKNNIPFE